MIDKQTVDKILDATDIVDVVGDFVSLRRRGTNWVGLCPFHNDRRPSFYVSRSKQICKCFACGKGGSAVNFLMEHEQFSYVEALRYLAKKYGIEIHERELTDEEREQQTERESMMLINEFALKFFESQLHDTSDGRDIGMAYFTERGMNEESIRKFHLGYSPEHSRALFDAAVKAGFSKKMLFDTGLCIDDHHGGGYDRFRGRVIFPVLNVAGRVVAFGGRTLKNDPAKYVNSPESPVYNKRKELYGLYQAKHAIGLQGKCFIVEGYFDVISMHQAGFENVIATSGTALTEDHIQKIRRFTDKVTELFDGDAAGIHAAMRGVDMLLKHGLNIKVLVLPNPEDPDSFARSHSSSQVQAYIDEHEEDFMAFKTRTLLQDSGNDPIRRSKAISEIVHSIAVIPDPITRAVYAKECSKNFSIDESVILGEINKAVAKEKDEDWRRRTRESARASREAQQQTAIPSTSSTEPADMPPAPSTPPLKANPYEKVERDMIRYIVKYGMCYLCNVLDEQKNQIKCTVTEYCNYELSADLMAFSVPAYAKIFKCAVESIDGFYADLDAFKIKLEIKRNKLKNEAVAEIQKQGYGSSQELVAQEKEIDASIESQLAEEEEDYRKNYLEKRLCSHPDDDIRRISCDFASDSRQLSKIHTQGSSIPTEYSHLALYVPKAIELWKLEVVKVRRQELIKKLTGESPEEQCVTQKEIRALDEQRRLLAKLTGASVVNTSAFR